MNNGVFFNIISMAGYIQKTFSYQSPANLYKEELSNQDEQILEENIRQYIFYNGNFIWCLVKHNPGKEMTIINSSCIQSRHNYVCENTNVLLVSVRNTFCKILRNRSTTVSLPIKRAETPFLYFLSIRSCIVSTRERKWSLLHSTLLWPFWHVSNPFMFRFIRKFKYRDNLQRIHRKYSTFT